MRHRDRVEKDRRWPAMLRKLKGLRKRGRRSIRIVDADCGTRELLIHTVRRTREVGFVATEAGILLTRVLWVKPGARHPFVVVDAATYDPWHEFIAVRQRRVFPRQYRRTDLRKRRHLCEGARDRPGAGGRPSLLKTAGAYGASMASTYNCRAIAPEVLVDGNRYATISERIPAHQARKQRLAPWMDNGAPSTRAA